MAKYGKTYWGAQFLNALENIDYSNRLPRGRSYAGKGSVKSIVFDKNKISAKVAGSRPKPYNVQIIIPEFTNDQKKELLEVIKNNSAILGSLLNRQLPNDLLQMAINKGIKIFPKEWKDFDMNCSCPDWAVPCKHLAAVIYIIANEIDLNPFKVLELHGLDVIKELSKEGIVLSENITEKIESLNNYFTKKEIEFTDNYNIDKLEELDFSIIPKYEDKFLSLLSPNPPFYEKDFKPDLLKLFRYAIKNINKHDFNKHLNNIDIYNCTNISIIAIDHGSTVFAELDFETKKERITLSELFAVFNSFENDKNLSPLIKILYHYFLFAKKIIEQGAVIPQLVVFNENCRILWSAFQYDSAVKLQINILNNYSSSIKIKSETEKDTTFFSDYENFSPFLISIFTTTIIEDVLRQDRRLTSNDLIQNLFFGSTIKLDKNNTDILNSIQLWLNRINIHKKDYVPVLEIKENFPEFYVGLKIKENSAEKINTPEDFHKFKMKNKARMLSVTKDLMHLQEYIPGIKQIINNDKKQVIAYDSGTFANFLLQITPLLNLLGIEVLLPKSLKHIIKPAASLSIKSNSSASVITYMDLMSILDFEWKIALGDELMNESEFLKLVKNMDGIVKIKDSFIHVNKEELDKLLKHLQNPARINKNQILQALLANEYNGSKIKISKDIQKTIQEFLKAEEVILPDKLLAKMRPYQLRGYEWLYKNSKIGFGSILADDMGLGKTLQTIALLLKFKENKMLEKTKALIIVPTTLISNWGKEIQKFAPSLKYHIYHGTKRNLNEAEFCDVVITSYGVVRSDTNILNKYKWQIQIIDEAQNIKNHNTDQTKAVKSIHSEIKIALSGTPVENRLSEYWSIFDYTNKGYLGSASYFNNEFAKPITYEKSHKHLDVFRKITSPFIMRRMKNDKNIISDLPDKIENNQYCTLTKQQAALYESTVKNALKTIETSDGIERKGLILKMMVALKQIGNHPFQYLKSGADSPGLSGKISVLFELIGNIIDNNEKTLIFTQYKEMGDLLQLLIRNEFNTEPLFLHGSLSRQQREKMVEEFQAKFHRKIFILSLKAGGTGLNLTQAQNVIHYDLWWNPAVENQATDRAYRIGQKNKVIVHRLINKGTIEERIDEMLQNKKELAGLTVASGETWIGELSNKELKELVKLTNDASDT